jgi:branched-subunit amino acid ABC-type transport system permease component
MDILVQLIFTGLATGGLYGLIGLGLVLIKEERGG